MFTKHFGDTQWLYHKRLDSKLFTYLPFHTIKQSFIELESSTTAVPPTMLVTTLLTPFMEKIISLSIMAVEANADAGIIDSFLHDRIIA